MMDDTMWAGRPHEELELLLDDYVDGAAPDAERRALETHLAGCAACRAQVARLRALAAAAAALPRSIEPGEPVWERVRAQIERERVTPLAAAAARPRWLRPLALAAAALLLVAGSSAITALVMRERLRPEYPGRMGHVAVGAMPARGSPLAIFAALENDYLHVAHELETTLAERRAALAPETVATIEASLRVIDQAILEARAALVRDPANHDLLERLSTTYEQKLDLLRRTAELPARS